MRQMSGTSMNPGAAPMQMSMTMHGSWMLMLHGVAYMNYIDASGPRGGDKFFSTNWLMPMAMRPLGQNGRYGQLTLRTMFSLEPATISDRQYPEFFQGPVRRRLSIH